MKFYVNYIVEVLFLILFVEIRSTYAQDDGFLNVTCNEPSDCYFLDDPNQGIQLACLSNVKKCKCQNTISSDFSLRWENNQCLVSKYGPCGSKGELAVGCQDDFACVDNQCRDPNNIGVEASKVTPFVFEDSKCSDGDCRFSEDLDLTCSLSANHCECKKVYIADVSDSVWDIRNYDGNKNCSVGEFGPCGRWNGIEINCHGDGITCVNGICSNADRLLSGVGEDCRSKKKCQEGLLCHMAYCIEPFSLGRHTMCWSENVCQRGLRCLRTSWGFKYCF